MTTIDITPVASPAALYCKYDSEHAVQGVCLYLDTRDGRMWCDYNGRIGNAVSSEEYHRLILAAAIPVLTADAANALMEEVRDLAQTVVDGAGIEWDGDNNVGVLTPEASAAWGEIEEQCDAERFDERSCVVAWDVHDWFVDGDDATIEQTGITAGTTDEQITKIAEEQAEMAQSQGASGFDLLDADDVAAYLKRLRDDLRDEVREELEEAAEELAEAEAKRDSLIRKIHAWGVDSWRDIAEQAGISHTKVGQIIKADHS